MKLKKLTAACLLAAMTCWTASADRFEKISRDFEARFAESPANIPAQLDKLKLNTEQREALEFLYAYMAWPDLADYSPEFFLQQTDYALRARKEMAWGKKVPMREWLHFVLPPRVNNENLDAFRDVCYEELKQRVEGLSMKEAALEVNHWCHEYVTYKPSDSRTSAPLASMRTATGRCGEESTFTVAALRTIGIPARQVYTPRWAHTDDNHAWVEAWIDGKWYFLGACEPEPVLNLGWFNQPASRGMLMHTKVFGSYDGPEDVMSRTPCYTEINVTRNYAPVKKTIVKVVDKEGNAVPDAHLEFKLYNYAEFYTVQTTRTNERGEAAITAGLGDMVAWASDGTNYGFVKFSVGKDKHPVVTLNRKASGIYFCEMDITPPVGKNNLPKVSAKAAAENVRRFAIEDSIRTAYVMTFPTPEKVQAFCEKTGADYARVLPLVEKSRGNYKNLMALVEKYPGSFVYNFLESMSEKDLRDFDFDIADSHLSLLATDSIAMADPFIFCPRVVNEGLSPWRPYFRKAFSAEEQAAFQTSPAALAEWIVKNVATDATWNPLSLCLSPESAHRLRTADVRSKGILFVAAARSLNIPARIDEVTGKVQFRMNAQSEWQTVAFSQTTDAQTAQAEQAELALAYTPRQYMEDPGYYYHFTLSKLEGGMPRLQNYEDEDTWAAKFKKGTKVDEGYYLLTSGTRMASGRVLARLALFPTNSKWKTETPLIMREDKEQVQVIGSFNSENRYFDTAEGKEKSVLATTGRGYFVVGLIRANHEPTNHILHDLEKQRAALEAWGRPILLLFPSEEEWQRFENNRSEFTNLPSTICFGVDKAGNVARDLFGGNLTSSEELPVVIIGDTFNRVVFSSQGYTIGIGEQIKMTVGKI